MILVDHADRKKFLVSYRRDRLDALLASARVTDVRPHLVSSCSEHALAAVHARITSAETDLGRFY